MKSSSVFESNRSEGQRHTLTMGLRFSTRWMPTIPRNAPKLNCGHRKGKLWELHIKGLTNGAKMSQPVWGFHGTEHRSVPLGCVKESGTHYDAGVLSNDSHVVGASGRDQTYDQRQQTQSQQRDGHPQSGSPPTQVLICRRGRTGVTESLFTLKCARNILLMSFAFLLLACN